MQENDPLYSLAEIAIAIAGFAAIVVAFKRNADGGWKASDADHFLGMLVHSIAAVLFCLLPSVLDVFIEAPRNVWSIASTLLGIQVLLHVFLIFRLPSSGRYTRMFMVVGVMVAGLQAYNAFGSGGMTAAYGPYLIGVMWHIFHAGGLFVSLVWVHAADIETSGDG